MLLPCKRRQSGHFLVVKMNVMNYAGTHCMCELGSDYIIFKITCKNASYKFVLPNNFQGHCSWLNLQLWNIIEQTVWRYSSLKCSQLWAVVQSQYVRVNGMWTQLCVLLQIPHLTGGQTRTDSDARPFRSSGWRFTWTYCHFSGTSLLSLQGLPVPVRTTSSLPESLKVTGLTAWAQVPMDILLCRLEILQPGFLRYVSLCGCAPLPALL